MRDESFPETEYYILTLIITFKELKISELEKLEVKKEAKENSGKEEISNLLKKVKK